MDSPCAGGREAEPGRPWQRGWAAPLCVMETVHKAERTAGRTPAVAGAQGRLLSRGGGQALCPPLPPFSSSRTCLGSCRQGGIRGERPSSRCGARTGSRDRLHPALASRRQWGRFWKVSPHPWWRSWGDGAHPPRDARRTRRCPRPARRPPPVLARGAAVKVRGRAFRWSLSTYWIHSALGRTPGHSLAPPVCRVLAGHWGLPRPRPRPLPLTRPSCPMSWGLARAPCAPLGCSALTPHCLQPGDGSAVRKRGLRRDERPRGPGLTRRHPSPRRGPGLTRRRPRPRRDPQPLCGCGTRYSAPPSSPPSAGPRQRPTHHLPTGSPHL